MSDRARVMVGVLCLVVLVGTGLPVGGQSASAGGIGDVSVTGSGVVTGSAAGNDSNYVWQDDPIDVSATFQDSPEFTNYRVCLGYERADAPPQELVDCDRKPLSPETNGTSEFTNVTWPSNVTGEQGLVVELQGLSNQYNTTLLDRKTVPVTVITRTGDVDADGLSNQQEVEQGYNLSNPDMDSDGLNDGPEVNRYGTNPQNPDTDGDGVRDGEELEVGSDPSATDTDGDWLSDGTELNLLRTNPTSGLTPIWLVGLVVLVGGLIVVGGTRFRRWWRDRDGRAAAENGGPSDPDGGDGVAPDEPEPEPTPEPAPEPLTDEDRVQGLLREHGGRMKQTRIVEETDWSKAKVSRLLSSMNDEGTIEKLSIGRENIVSLDGHGPEAARSPHEEPPEENASD